MSVAPDDRLVEDGAQITGRFMYDPSAAGTPFPSGSGSSFPAITALSGDLEGNMFGKPTGGVLIVDDAVDLDSDSVGQDLRDLFLIIASDQSPGFSGFIIGDGEFQLNAFRLFYIEGSTPYTPFADGLPATLPPPDPAVGRISLTFDELTQPGFIRQVFAEPVSLRVVPVPPAFLLFGSGLAMLGWLRGKTTS